METNIKRSKYSLNQFVYFMHNNQVCKDKIKSIHFGCLFVVRNGDVEQTSVKYVLTGKYTNDEQHECWLFPDKQSLLDSL